MGSDPVREGTNPWEIINWLEGYGTIKRTSRPGTEFSDSCFVEGSSQSVQDGLQKILTLCAQPDTFVLLVCSGKTSLFADSLHIDTHMPAGITSVRSLADVRTCLRGSTSFELCVYEPPPIRGPSPEYPPGASAMSARAADVVAGSEQDSEEETNAATEISSPDGHSVTLGQHWGTVAEVLDMRLCTGEIIAELDTFGGQTLLCSHVVHGAIILGVAVAGAVLAVTLDDFVKGPKQAAAALDLSSAPLKASLQTHLDRLKNCNDRHAVYALSTMGAAGVADGTVGERPDEATPSHSAMDSTSVPHSRPRRTPRAVTPNAVTPKAVTPNAVTPKVVTPKVVTRKRGRPKKEPAGRFYLCPYCPLFW